MEKERGMRTIWRIDTGAAIVREDADAMELLRRHPDVYTSVDPTADDTPTTEYGLDLKTVPAGTSGDARLGLTVTKADIRFVTGDICEIVGEGAPVDYTDGSPPATGEGFAGVMSRYTDITGKKLYVNTGTLAEPAWTELTQVA
jgi:hypothetical protein